MGLLKELTAFFKEYSVHHEGPDSSPLSGPLQLVLDNQRKLIGVPENTVAIFNRWLEGPQSGWQVDDWEAVDKYPRQSSVQTTTQDARSEINSVAVRSGASGRSGSSRAQGSATRLSGRAYHSGQRSLRHGSGNASGFSSSQRPLQGSGSSRLSHLPSLLSPDSPLPSPPFRPSSQQSSLTADTPNSIKRPLDTYEEREEGGKKAKTDTLSSPGGNSLHIFLDDTEREKLKVFRTALYPRPFRSSAATSTQSSSDDSSGSERAQSPHNDTPDLDETQHSALSDRESAYDTPCNSSPALSTNSLPVEDAITDFNSSPRATSSPADSDFDDLLPSRVSPVRSLNDELVPEIKRSSTSNRPRFGWTYSKRHRDRKGKGRAREV